MHLLFQMVFEQNIHPEQLYRTCDGLLRLQKSASAGGFAAACELAMDVHNLSYRFVERILKNNMVDNQDKPKQEQSLPDHQNIRGKEYYSQSTIKF